jgi:hypothetical protein
MSEAEQLPTPTLDGKRLKAVEMLAQGVAKSKVASAVGIDRSTVYAWLDEPEFANAVAEQKRKLEFLILDPTPFLQGIVQWKARLPDVMAAVAKTALDSDNPRQIRAAELILKHTAAEDLSTGPTEDEKVIEAWLEQNGWTTKADAKADPE